MTQVIGTVTSIEFIPYFLHAVIRLECKYGPVQLHCHGKLAQRAHSDVSVGDEWTFDAERDASGLWVVYAGGRAEARHARAGASHTQAQVHHTQAGARHASA